MQQPFLKQTRAAAVGDRMKAWLPPCFSSSSSKLNAILLFAHSFQGLQSVLEQLVLIGNAGQRAQCIQLEWWLDIRDMSRSGDVFTALLSLKTTSYPQLTVHINLYGPESDEMAVYWAHVFAYHPEFQVSPGSPSLLFNIHTNRNAYGPILTEILSKGEFTARRPKIKVLAGCRTTLERTKRAAITAAHSTELNARFYF